MAETLKERTGASNVLIVVDSLQTWARGTGGDAVQYEALGEAIQVLGRVAQTLQCPLIFTSERNRLSNKPGEAAKVG